MNNGLLGNNQSQGVGVGANGLFGFPRGASTLIETSIPPRDDLHLWLERGGSGSVWQNQLGDGLDGTLKNGASWSGGAVQLDGVNDTVQDFPRSISPAGYPRTVMIWATNTDATFARRGLIGTRGSGSPANVRGFIFGQWSSTQLLYNVVGVASLTPTVTMPAASTRACYAVTQAGPTVIFYLNGVAVSTTTSFSQGEIDSGFNGVLGTEQDSDTTEIWKGSMDRVLIWRRALTAAEIAATYAALV